MTKKHKVHKDHHKHGHIRGVDNTINIHIHDHEKKKHKKAKKKTTKKKSLVEGVDMHYPLILPSNQPTVIHAPPYNYDNRPNPYEHFSNALESRLKMFANQNVESTDMTKKKKSDNNYRFDVPLGEYNARVRVKMADDGSNALHIDNLDQNKEVPKEVKPKEVITPEWITTEGIPTPAPVPATANIDVFGDQIPLNGPNEINHAKKQEEAVNALHAIGQIAKDTTDPNKDGKKKHGGARQGAGRKKNSKGNEDLVGPGGLRGVKKGESFMKYSNEEWTNPEAKEFWEMYEVRKQQKAKNAKAVALIYKKKDETQLPTKNPTKNPTKKDIQESEKPILTTVADIGLREGIKYVVNNPEKVRQAFSDLYGMFSNNPDQNPFGAII
jgi:hypothetical protein